MADSQYIIDIAAEMPEGDATIKELDALTAELTGAGQGADHFEQAIRAAGDAMSAARAQAKQANDALALGTAEYDRLERAAVRMGKASEVAVQKHAQSVDATAAAAAALAANAPRVAALQHAAQEAAKDLAAGGEECEDLALAATRAASALASISEEHSRLSKAADQAAKAEARAAAKITATQSAAAEAKGAIEAYTPTLKQLEQASEQANAAQDKHSKTLKKVQELARHTDQSFGKNKASLDAYKAAFEVSGGPIGRFAGRLVDMRSKFVDLSGKVGASSARLAFLAAGAASVAAGFFVLGAAGAAVIVTLGAIGIAASNAHREIGLTREALGQLSPEFASAASAFDEVTAATGASEEELIAHTKALKGAKVAAAQMPAALRAIATAEAALGKGGASEFVEQLRSGKKSVSELSREIDSKFGGIAARRMLGLGEQSKTLKRHLSDLFGGLELEPLLLGLDRLVGMFDETHVIGRAIKMTFEGIFGPLVAGADGASVRLEAFVLDTAIFLTKGYIEIKKFHNNLKATWDSIATDIEGAVKTARDLVGPAMYDLGSDMISGAIKGIFAQQFPLSSALVAAFTGAGKDVDKAIGRHSPSKEYDDRAQDIMRGAERGIKKREGDYKDALDHAMVPSSNTSGKVGEGLTRIMQSSSTSNATASADFSGAQFIFNGVAGAEDAEDRIVMVINKVLRGDAARMSGAEAGGL